MVVVGNKVVYAPRINIKNELLRTLQLSAISFDPTTHLAHHNHHN